jgi:hypothetical protein
MYYNTYIWMDLLHQVHRGFTTASTTLTTAKLDLRNNIIYNNSTGSGLAVAFRRSSANLQNYASSSNNNLFLGANLMNNGTAYSISGF